MMDPRSSQPGQGRGSGIQPQRKYGATRVFPRIEVGRPKESQAEPRPDKVAPEGEELTPGEMGTAWDLAGQGGGGGGLFAPRTFGGDRVRVYGCSPGCLLVSVVISLVLTFLLNAIF